MYGNFPCTYLSLLKMIVKASTSGNSFLFIGIARDQRLILNSGKEDLKCLLLLLLLLVLVLLFSQICSNENRYICVYFSTYVTFDL